MIALSAEFPSLGTMNSDDRDKSMISLNSGKQAVEERCEERKSDTRVIGVVVVTVHERHLCVVVEDRSSRW